MRIINLIYKEVLENLRDRRSMIIMTLFPIVLIVILGTAFSKVFDKTTGNIVDVKVLYTNVGKGNISESFNSFINETKGIGIKYTEANDIQKGIDSMKDANYSCYININEDKDVIELYKNDRYNFNANLVENILDTFVQRYNVMMEIAVANPRSLQSITNDNNVSFVNRVSLQKEKAPRAIDYYAVSMITLILMYASMTGAFSMQTERTRKTGSRVFCSPVSKPEFFIGKIFGCFIITSFQCGLVLLFSKYVLKTDWGNDLGIILLILMSEIIMSLSLGIGVAFITKNDAAITSILQAIIPVVVFFGGGYAPLEVMNSKLVYTISNFSPVKWINEAIFNVIYAGNYNGVSQAIIINISAAAVLLIISSVILRREGA